jgi:hypothetical protein
MDYQTDDYRIEVVENKEGVEVYVIVNRTTGVTEYEDYLLPRTVDTLMELQKRLEEVNRRFENPPLAVVEGGKDGEVGLH